MVVIFSLRFSKKNMDRLANSISNWLLGRRMYVNTKIMSAPQTRLTNMKAPQAELKKPGCFLLRLMDPLLVLFK